MTKRIGEEKRKSKRTTGKSKKWSQKDFSSGGKCLGR